MVNIKRRLTSVLLNGTLYSLLLRDRQLLLYARAERQRSP